MGTMSYNDICPNCGKQMECSKGSNPLDTSGSCMYCGYYYLCQSGQMDIAEINELRKEFNEALEDWNELAEGTKPRKLRMLTKLPRMSKFVVS